MPTPDPGDGHEGCPRFALGTCMFMREDWECAWEEAPDCPLFRGRWGPVKGDDANCAMVSDACDKLKGE